MLRRSCRVFGVIIAIASLTTIVAPFFVNNASAAGTGISLTTSPASLDLVIQPGTSVTKNLLLTSNGSEPVPINMALKLFGAQGNTGQAAITQPLASDPSPSWVHFSPSSFTAQPGVQTTVKMTIDLPKTASLGYYYAVIFQPTIPTSTVAKAATVKGSNAILILVDTQSSNESRQAQIASFSVDKKVYEYLPTTFTISIHNQGNIYLAPTGNIFISKNAAGTNTIDTINVNASGANVLPNSTRNFTTTWSDGFPAFTQKTLDRQPLFDKHNRPIEQLSWDFNSTLSKFRFGKYYAKITLIYNNGSRIVPITGVVSFWVIPWKLALLVLGAIIASIVIWTYLKKAIKSLWRKLF